MQILFSFDTEDYIDPVSNDALLRLAEIHTKHDVPACFGIVGEKARFLRDCGRREVIEAVARHEVAYHSDHHFILPDDDYAQAYVPEYMETQPWDRAMKRLLAEESRGVHDVAEIFGKAPVTWLRNFGDWAPHYLVAFAWLGVPVYAYGPSFHNLDPLPLWYCNQLVIANPRHTYEQNLHDWSMTPQEKLEQHKQNLLKHLEQGTPRLGWVTHPTRFIADTWWEDPNWFDRMDSPPRADWQSPPRFDPERIDELLWIAEGFVKFASELPDVEPLTFADFCEQHREQRQWMTRRDVVRLAQHVSSLAETGGAPSHLCLDDDVISPAGQFGVFAVALAVPDAEEILVRYLLGPTEDPADTPAGVASGRDELVAAAREVEFFIRDKARVASAIQVGHSAVGPGGFLFAMARALASPDAETIPVPPAANLPEPLHPDDYEKMSTGNPASYIQKRSAPDWDMPNTRRHAQLQYWTVKPAVG